MSQFHRRNCRKRPRRTLQHPARAKSSSSCSSTPIAWPISTNAPVIAANARNKGTRKHLKSVYYDTPKRTLRRNGLSLRVRQSGARFVQTVKTECGDDPLRRGEWEAPSFLAPDLALAMPFIPEKLRSDLAAQPLEAVFTADIRRHPAHG